MDLDHHLAGIGTSYAALGLGDTDAPAPRADASD
jgi:hypothetical protein